MFELLRQGAVSEQAGASWSQAEASIIHFAAQASNEQSAVQAGNQDSQSAALPSCGIIAPSRVPRVLQGGDLQTDAAVHCNTRTCHVLSTDQERHCPVLKFCVSLINSDQVASIFVLMLQGESDRCLPASALSAQVRLYTQRHDQPI